MLQKLYRRLTGSYRKDEDIIGRFIDERLNIDGKTTGQRQGKRIKLYQSWCNENGLKAESPNQFGKDMKSRFDSDPE